MTKVKLISITKPVFADEDMSAEDLIVYCARVSNPENQNNNETSAKLLKYLKKHKHWSPFEMVDICFEIKTSRYVAQQMIRHRSFSFQEFSQRYSSVTKITPVDLRIQCESNRQSSKEGFEDETIKNLVDETIKTSFECYNKLLDAGIAREVARGVLPLATETTLYMKGSLRSWIHYLDLRCNENTQLEHREVANNILCELRKNFPNVFST